MLPWPSKKSYLHAHDLLALLLLALPHVLVIVIGEVGFVMGSVAMVALQISRVRLQPHLLHALAASIQL